MKRSYWEKDRRSNRAGWPVCRVEFTPAGRDRPDPSVLSVVENDRPGGTPRMTFRSPRGRCLLSTLGAALTVLCLLAMPAGAAGLLPRPALQLRGSRILVCDLGYPDLLHLPAVVRLEKAGAQVRQGNLDNLSWNVARQYRVIIAIVEQRYPPQPHAAAVKTLVRFVQAGGGLMYFNYIDGVSQAGMLHDMAQVRDLNQVHWSEVSSFLKPFGAAIPWQTVLDPAHQFTNPTGFDLPYAYTDRITPGSPLTAGVKGLWYNAQRRALLCTEPLLISKQWTILASAMPQARALWLGGSRPGRASSLAKKGGLLPIVAARKFGAGRIVLFGLTPMEVFYGQGLASYGDIAWSRGNGLQRSDFGALYNNALNWLARRAGQATTLGQGALKPVVNPWAVPATLPDWSKLPPISGLIPRPMRGVIGLHSTLSDGQATPQELITAARKLHLQWVAFTERLEDFSPAKWKELTQICRQTSTANFLALPGLDYADLNGTRYVAFGYFNWPPAKYFSQDKKHLIGPQWWFAAGMPPNGPYEISRGPLHYWDLSLYNAFAIRTAIAGKTVQTARQTLKGFLHMTGVQDDPEPMAVAMCYNAAQLAAAAANTCNYWLYHHPGPASRLGTTYGYLNPSDVFISNGPLVTAWRAINATRITGGKWWLPGSEQYRVQLAARSTAPLTDIRIYDGPYLLLRFRPNKQRVALQFDLPHDEQRYLTAEITDASGRKAFTDGIFVRDFLNFRFMCGDRGNSICDGVETGRNGPYLTGPTAPYQRKMTVFGAIAGYGEPPFDIIPPLFDGGIRSVGFVITPRLGIDHYSYAPAGAILEKRMGIPVCSVDGLLQRSTVTGYFPGQADAWSPKPAPHPIQSVRVHYSTLAVTPEAHGPGVLFVRGTVRVNRPLRLTSLNLCNAYYPASPGGGNLVALVTPEKSFFGMCAGKPAYAQAAAAPGSFAEIFPSLWGAGGIITLDKGYRLDVGASQRSSSVGLSLDRMPRRLTPGDSLRFRYLLVRGALREQPNTRGWEALVREMGLRGRPAYTVTEVKAGRVAGTRFGLTLSPHKGGVRAVISRADLPIRLPVFVSGMNPNWTFAWFDLNRHEWFPSAVNARRQQGYFTLDLRKGPYHIFAGEPVLANDPRVRVEVLSDGKTYVRAGLDNVGNQLVRVTVRLNPALGAAPPQTVQLGSGAIKSVTFALTSPP